MILRWSRCRAILVGTVAGWCVVCPARAQTIPPPPDPGRISNENLRNQRQIQRETEPQLEGPTVVGPAAPPAVIGPSGESRHFPYFARNDKVAELPYPNEDAELTFAEIERICTDLEPHSI